MKNKQWIVQKPAFKTSFYKDKRSSLPTQNNSGAIGLKETLI